MADERPNVPKLAFDQADQTVRGSQINIAGDVNMGGGIFNSMIVAFCVSVLISLAISVLGGGLFISWSIALPCSIVSSWSFALYHARVLRVVGQRRKEQERRYWHTLPTAELEPILKASRWSLWPLIKDSEHGLAITKQQREQWLVLIADIELIKSIIEDRGDSSGASAYDLREPPTPPMLSRILLLLKANLSYLLSMLLIAGAATIGTTVPRAAETLVIKLQDLLPIPSSTPTPTPQPTLTKLPANTPTPSIESTLVPTPTPTLQPTLTKLPINTPTPSIESTLVPTASSTASPTLRPPAPLTTTPERILVPTAIISVTPNEVTGPTTTPTVDINPAPDTALSTTGATTGTIIPGIGLEPLTPTPAEVTNTPPPTTMPTVAIGTLTGRIAYSILSGEHYDTVVRDVTTKNVVYRASYARQPDLKSGGYMLVNKEGGGLVRVDLNRGDERQITERDEDARPHWAANDDRVTFESFEANPNGTILKLQENAALQSNPPYLHSPTGSTIRGRNAIFLEDGRIAFNACGSWQPTTAGSCGLWIINSNGSGIIRVSDQPHDYPSDNFRSQILFTSDRNRNWDVYITQPNLQIQRLTDDPARDGLATSSPIGDHIAFVSDRSGQWAIWVMNTDGTGQQKLFDLEGSFGNGERDWTTEKISWGL